MKKEERKIEQEERSKKLSYRFNIKEWRVNRANKNSKNKKS